MNKKKLLALLMALVMTLSLVPVTALAEPATASAPTTDYNGEELPAGPEMNGDVINVTAANAQYVLDGAYGNINGKTINFTGNIDYVLELARPTKYQGSGTTYYNYVNSVLETTETPWSEDISSIMNSGSHYYRTLSNVTFTANKNVTLAGFTFSAGHAASTGYDYVRCVEQTSGVTHYRHVSLSNITFKDLKIAGAVDFRLYLEGSTVSNITFDGCDIASHNMNETTKDGQAINLRADNQYYSNVIVKNCNLHDSYQGLHIQGIDGLQILNNKVVNTTHNAFGLQSSKSNDAKGTIIVKENYVSGANDRAIRINNVSAEAQISINNNAFVNSGDSDGELIKAGTIASGATINLEHNYWCGKELSTVINNGLTAPTAVGLISGTFPVDVSAYCAEGYTATESNGVWTVGPAAATTNVAEVNGTQYATLEAAFAAAQDGQTITLLANCAGNGIKAPQGKFTTGLTVDFAGFTYTVDGNTVGSTGTETNGFQLLMGNKITFKNGTITSEKAKILVQNYSDLTLKGMTLTLNNSGYASAYTLSNNNGNVVIDGSTINANPAGGYAFDVCRFSSYPSVNVTVTGNSAINGDVEISASGSDAKDGFGLTLTSGTITGDIVMHASAAAAMAAAPEKVSITKSSAFEQAAPTGYKWVDAGNGTSSLAKITYVARIGDVKYETLEAAFAAAADGDTITLLADCAGNGIKAPQGKFTNGLTVDFNGKTYTVDGATVGSTGTETNGFQLLKDNTITFKNGTITSEKAKILVQNYSNLTLDKMTLTLNNSSYSSAYTLSNNNGNVVIDGSTINANPAGSFAFDVCRYASYTSVNVEVKGDSTINGDVEISASNGDAKDGFRLTLTSGRINGDIVLDASAKTAMAAADEKAIITKASTFEQDAPAGYYWYDGKLTAIPENVVAQIGNVTYSSLEAAFAEAADGDTITLLANCSGNGIIAPQGKFGTGLTVNFAGYTYTVNGETLAGSTGTKTQAFQLLKGNTITFKNGAIVGDNADVKMLIQNYSNLTLEKMTLDATKGKNSVGYVLSTNNGSTVIKDTTITAKTGGVAFDVDSGWGNYPSNSVEVTGSSVINGNVEVAFEGKTAGTPSVLILTSGTLDGEIVMGTGAAQTTVTKASTFTQAAPADYAWSEADQDGVQTLEKLPDVAQVGDKMYTSLAGAIAAAQNGDTVKLLANVSATSQIEVSEKLTLDLNNYSITYTGENSLPSGVILVHRGGDLTICDNSVSAAGAVLSGDKAYAAVALTHKDDNESDGAAKLTVNNGHLTGYYYGIVGNGSRHNTEITVNGGTITGTTGSAIYHPQNGTLTVTDGDLTGKETAIEIRAGKLAISGGTFTATDTPTATNANGSGTTSSGAAIAVAQHTTLLPIDVSITGGTFNGYSAFYESNPQKNSPEAIKKITLSISEGTFNTAQGGSNAVYCADFATIGKFITGGTFSSEPDKEYIAESYAAVQTGGESKWQVGKVVTTSVTGENITETAIQNNSITYTVNTSVVDSSNEELGSLGPVQNLTVTGTTADGDNLYSSVVTDDETNKKPVGAAALSQLKDASAIASVIKAAVSNASSDASSASAISVVLVSDAGTETKDEQDDSKVTKVTYEVHPEAIVYSEQNVIGSYHITNDQLNGTFNFKLNAGNITGVVPGKKILVTHVLDTGNTEELGPFEVDSEGYIVVTGVTEFSEFTLEEITTDTVWAKFGYTISLDDSISIVFNVKNLADPNPGNYTITYGTDGTPMDKWTEKKLTDPDLNSFTIGSFAAKEMGDEVHVIVKHNDTVIKDSYYSIKKYCDKVIEGNYSDALKDICKATLDYGRYAQETFNYKTDNYVTSSDYFTNSAITVPASNTSKTNYNSTVTGVSMALVTTYKTQLVVYFKAESNPTSITVNGDPYTDRTTENGRVKVVVEGISARDLNEKVTVVFTDNIGSYNYEVSPVDYMGLAVAKGSLVKVNRAFYNYYLKAAAYFASKQVNN